MSGNTYFNLIRFYNPLRIIAAASGGCKLGSPDTSGVTRRQSRVCFVDCKGILTPILRTWVQKSTLLLQNRGHAKVLKKTPSSAKYVTKVRSPPPPPPPLYLSAPPPRAKVPPLLSNLSTFKALLCECFFIVVNIIMWH